MATHSRTVAWRIPWTEEPGGLQSMGSHLDTPEPLTLSPFTFNSHSVETALQIFNFDLLPACDMQYRPLSPDSGQLQLPAIKKVKN